MTAPSQPATLAQVLNFVVTQRLADVHTAMPARVEKYDAAKQVADCAPLLQAMVETEAGPQLAALPVVPNVPVVFPGGGDFRVTFPVKPGDVVLLVFSEASLERWQSLDGVQSGDGRRHHIADAIAIPGLHSNAKPWQGASTSALTMGHNTGPGVVMTSGEVQLGARDGQAATQAVLLGNDTTAALDALATDLTTQLGQAIGFLSAAAVGLTAASVANAVPIVGGILAAPGFATVVAQLGLLGGVMGQMVTSVAALKAKLPLLHSGIVKTR